MTLTIDLAPKTEAWLSHEAQQRGVAPQEYVQSILDERAGSVELSEETPTISAKNAAAIAMLKKWREEDATDDPELIRQAEEELEELKRNLNANRAAVGDRLAFP